MADLDRIKRNVAKMAKLGAPENEIDSYISSEGVSLDEVRGHRSGGWLRGIAQGAVDMVRGKQDPAYENAPALFNAPDLTPQAQGRLLEGNAGARTSAISDEAYADILQSQLGDSFIGREQDAHGYPVLSYRNRDGQESKAYANRPGLDWADIDRTAHATMPYLLGGGLVGSAMRNFNLPLRAVAQGVTGAGVSVGQDVGANAMGSQQGIDVPRAGLAGVLGAGGELLAPAVQAGKSALGFGAKYVDDAGRLTPEGVSAARRAGVDPKELDAETTAAFAEALRVGRDPVEVLASVRTNRFGIPTTKGQRTKNPELLAIEKDIRAGNLKEDARRSLEEFDQQQAHSITAQVRGHVVPGRDGIDEYRGLGAEIAPTRMPHEQNAETMGQSIRTGLTGARDTLKEREVAAWEAMPDITPRPAAFDDLIPSLNGRIGDMYVDAQLTPTAMRMDTELAAFRDGKGLSTDGPKMVQQTAVRTIDQMRRRLLGMYKAAAPGSPDAKAAKAYYDGFNDWVWDIAEKGLINGDPAAAAKMTTAREISREVKGLFKPRTSHGRPAPSDRILSQVMDDADTSEGVIAALLGSSGPHTVPRAGTVDALNRIKTILEKAGDDAGSMASKETWNDIRLAYWLRLTTDKSGATLSPTMLRKGIDQAFASQHSVLRTLFSDGERSEMRAFARAVGEASYKDPNPSGTATALRALSKNNDGVAKTFFQAQANRELFSKHNVWMSRFYRMLSKKVPADPMGAMTGAGSRAAQRAIDHRLSPHRPPATGPFFSAYGGQNE